jgi:hypothetical protein
MVESFPLSWPTGRKRTDNWRRESAAFKTTMGKARDALLRQLRLLNARDIVISSNVATYTRSGEVKMYADQSAAKEDPGVAVYYTWDGDQYALSCDKWNTVTDNLQALNKAVEAIRVIERWGTGEMMKAAFSGFKPLPEPPKEQPKAKTWWEILGISQHAFDSEIRDAYRRLAKIHHPDAGGSAVMFNLINQAYQQGMAAKR